MILMALDHVRMYFAPGAWYAQPTDLATTTPLLFFTRWITHFCAPVFVFLAGAAASLYGIRQASLKKTAGYLLSRGLWLIFAELVIVNFAWTFDLTYSFRILQVIWAIGISMVALSALVFLPESLIFLLGVILVIGHNLLDPITLQGGSLVDMIWYTLHQPNSVFLNGTLINFVYPVLPWIGLMALGYVFGLLYKDDFPPERRRRWMSGIGLAAVASFILLRALNVYGEPHPWQPQNSGLFSLMSFLNTTKYPPSLHFLFMTMGPALVLLSLIDRDGNRLPRPVIVFGKVPFFFYIVHLYLIHALALLLLAYQGGDPGEYILSARAIMSGRLRDFGLGLGAVYILWAAIVTLLYPLCRRYRKVRAEDLSRWWLRYL